MSNQQKFNMDEEIDLKKLFDAALNNIIFIISITSVAAIASIIYSLNLPNQYQATMVIAPVNNSGSLTSSDKALGGLASLAGINLSSEGVSDSQSALMIMQSWGFLEEFVERNNLGKYLLATKGWDDTNNVMIFDENVFDIDKEEWVKAKPTSWSLYKAFSNRLLIHEDGQTGIITVKFNYYSPQLSKEWVELLVQDINSFMRQRKIIKVGKSISYLQEQINKTSIKDMRNAFYKIMSEQIKQQMLAESTPDFVFVTISKAMVPVEKAEPTRSIIVIISTIVGFLFSLFITLIKFYRDGFSLKPDDKN